MTEEVMSALGNINCYALENANHFLFGIFSDEDTREMLPANCPQPQKPLIIIELALAWLRPFLRASWLIKDNCVSLESAFAFYPHEGPLQIASSNSLHELNITCNGQKFDECKLTVTELSELIKLHNQVETSLWQCRDEHGEGIKGKNSRIVRCFEFLHCARTSYSIPLRMAHYCSAFEALFASNATELTHRLSERIAHFVGKTVEQRKVAYGIAKRAYALRSQVVHGSSLSEDKIAEIFVLCSETDELLRNVLRRIITETDMWSLLSSSNEKIDAFFLDRLMGCE
jgi:Apea-like HEPN